MLFRIKQNGVDTLLKFARAYAMLLGLTFVELSVGLSPVSYTHLDVYKRQSWSWIIKQ